MREASIKGYSAAQDFAARAQQIFIGGKYVASSGSDTIDVFNPGSGEVFATIADATPSDTDAAVAAAREAFQSPVWAGMIPSARRDLLLSIADHIDRHKEELAAIETLDTGKIYQTVLYGEIPGTINIFRYFAGWCDKIRGTTPQPFFEGTNQPLVIREPIGVAALIVPWNFPLPILAMKLAPALAAGCTTVIKPAEDTSLSTLRLAGIMHEAGVPNGVINVVTGQGGSVGAHLARHEGVDKVSFTGSTATGKGIVHDATSNLKRVTLELGGKGPAIILADADIGKAAQSIAPGAFFNCGQNCVAMSRILIDRKIKDAFLDQFLNAVRGLKMGDGFEEGTMLGPLVSERHRKRVAGYVETGIAEGAELVLGGRAPDRPGFYFEPTVFDRARHDMTIVREEIFGPVVSVETFDSPEEIPSLVNNSPYGLYGTVWTDSLSTGLSMIKQLRIGGIGLNTVMASGSDMPFGGYRQSGWGREMGSEALDAYLETKSVVVASA